MSSPCDEIGASLRDASAASKPTRGAGSNASPTAERPLTFTCQGDQLLGILHPAGGPTGVVIVVGGPQVRTGSHRQFVQLARALAVAGYPVLRFDVRGMGDSSGHPRSFEHITPDIGAAIETLMVAQPHLHGVVLWGLCDGASAALLYMHDRADEKVAGLCLVNPWTRSEVTQAQVHVKHYYKQRLLQATFWRKLFSGGVGLRALTDLMRSVRSLASARDRAGHSGHAAPADYIERMAVAWRHFRKPVLLLLSADDFTAREFEATLNTHLAWRGVDTHGKLTRHKIPGGDHTFSSPSARQAAEQLCIHWLRQVEVRDSTGY